MRSFAKDSNQFLIFPSFSDFWKLEKNWESWSNWKKWKSRKGGKREKGKGTRPEKSLIGRARQKEMTSRRKSTRISKMNFISQHESSSEDEMEDSHDIQHIKEAPKIFDPSVETIFTRKIM